MAEYKGKKVKLDDPFRLPSGSDKKFGVYVKNPSSGNVIMVKFGDPNLSIKRDDPERLKNFRARHNCAEKKDKTTPGYWSCKFWEKNKPVSKLLKKGDVSEAHCEAETGAMFMNLTPAQARKKQAQISSKGVFGYKNAKAEAKRIKKLYPNKNVTIMQHSKRGNFKFATDSIGIRRLENQGFEMVEVIKEDWSKKYKDSIDCDNPKGFSQKAHCQGKKKRAEEEQECNCGCDDCMNEEAYLPGQATTKHGGKSGRGGKPGPRMSRQRKNRAAVLDHLALNGIRVLNQPADVRQKGSSDTFVVAKKDLKRATDVVDDYFSKKYVRMHMAKNQLRRENYKIIAEDVNEAYEMRGLGSKGLKRMGSTRKQATLLFMFDRESDVVAFRNESLKKYGISGSYYSAGSKMKILLSGNENSMRSYGPKILQLAKKYGGEYRGTNLEDKNFDKMMSESVNEVYKDSGLGDWFGKGGGGGKEKGGWDRYNASGERIGKCGDAKKGDAYSACLSAEKADQLGKEGRAEFVRRKRAAQKKAGDKAKGGESKKGQKPVMVKTGAKGLDKKNESYMSFGKFLREGENKPNNPSLWKKAIAKAKEKFDVYPSAYANAWASKWYKSKGGTWSKK